MPILNTATKLLQTTQGIHSAAAIRSVFQKRRRITIETPQRIAISASAAPGRWSPKNRIDQRTLSVS